VFHFLSDFFWSALFEMGNTRVIMADCTEAHPRRVCCDFAATGDVLSLGMEATTATTSFRRGDDKRRGGSSPRCGDDLDVFFLKIDFWY
jgi:hypothetical protein